MSESIKHRNKEYLNYIYGIKGIAAFVIAFFWHYQHFLGCNPSRTPLSSVFILSSYHGWIFVELFFILSGYGISLGYKELILTNKVSFQHFLITRINKIYPLFIFTTLAVTVLQYLFILKTGETFIYPYFDLYHFALNVLCIHNGVFGVDLSFNSPSWCLPILLLCYSIYFIIIRKGNNVIINSLACIITGILILNVCYKYNIDFPLFNRLLARGIVGFGVGVILYELEKYIKFCNLLRFKIISLEFLILTYIVYRKYGVEILVGSQSDYDIILFADIITFPLLLFCVKYVDSVKKVFGCTLLTELGSISYEVYLIHFPVQCLFKILEAYLNINVNYGSIFIWGIVTIATILISFVYKKYFSNITLVDMARSSYL